VRLIDAHLHLLPSPLAERVRGLFDTYLPGRTRYPLEVPVLVEQLAAEGVTGAWTLPYAHRPGVAGWLNDETAALRDRWSDGPVPLVAGATVHAGDEDPAAIVGHAVLGLGARVLKLHCAVGSFEVDDARLEPVWDLCAELRLPVVLHAGHDPLGRTETTHLRGVAAVADRHPGVPLIVAHCGHPAVDATLELLARHLNLHADLTPVVADPVVMTPADLARFADRLLFGSDAPNTGVRVTELLERLCAAGLRDDALAAITHANAERLVAGVTAAPPPTSGEPARPEPQERRHA
jgi:uncharacterized protein